MIDKNSYFARRIEENPAVFFIEDRIYSVFDYYSLEIFEKNVLPIRDIRNFNSRYRLWLGGNKKIHLFEI